METLPSSQPPPKFTFSEYDIGNSLIVPAEKGSLSFAFSTQRGILSVNRSSTITFSDANGNQTTGASIDWLKRTIDIMGVSKPFSDIKHKPGGMLSSGRDWQWAGKRYATSIKDKICTIKSNEETLAVLTPVIIHTFDGDEPATLTFHKDLTIEEKIFLIFAITFITLQDPPPDKRPKTAKATVGGIVGGLAVEAATTAVFGCCSIQ